MSKAREGGRSSKDHSKKIGFCADEWGTSYPCSPALLVPSRCYYCSELFPWLSTALWIKSKLLSLAFEDK